MHDLNDLGAVLAWIQAQAAAENVRITQHAQQEMAEEDITLDDVLESIKSGWVIENYPDHKRGSCCLFSGRSRLGRALHIVCTSRGSTLILVTAYEPKAPKWITPTERG
ncbi:MAG: DUF4258 domain-containing protein [Thermomicrobiales bacterium]